MSNINTYEKSLVKIKEGDMKFVAAIFKMGDEWAAEEYEGNAKAYVRNSPDGCYEVFVIVTQTPEEVEAFKEFSDLLKQNTQP